MMWRINLIQGWRRAWRLTSVQAAALLTVASVLMVLRNELLPLFEFAISPRWWPWITGIWGAAIIIMRLIAQPGVLGPAAEDAYLPPAAGSDNRQRGWVLNSVLPVAAAVAVALLAGIAIGHGRATAKCAKTASAAQAKAAQTSASATVATAAVASSAADKQVEIKTVFKDRVIKQFVEVPREVIVKEDAGCVIPARFVGL